MITFPKQPGLCNFSAILPIFYLIPSYGLFGLINYTMHYGPTRKQYKGPFFTLFTLYTIVAVFLSLAIYFQGHFLAAPMYLPLVTAMPQHGAWPAFTLALLYYSIISGQLVNSFITVNRFTVIFLKTNYPFFWRRYMKFFIVFIFTAPFILIWQFPFSDVQIYMFYPPTPSMGYHIKEGTIGPIDKAYVMIATFGGTGIMSLGMNSYISCFLIKSFMPHGEGRRGGEDHDESSPTNVRFFAFNIFVFVLEICTAVLQGLMQYIESPYVTEPHLYFIQVYVAELNAFGPAWFMFFINTPLRTDIFTLIRRRTVKHRNVAIKSLTVTMSAVPKRETRSMF
uniref:Serpentine receptor class gamma n=1 Tax=Panagrellus redivivus TaxID=6233 RepID=A0A7E4VEM1_PANRE